jgi:hypothetical protein
MYLEYFLSISQFFLSTLWILAPPLWNSKRFIVALMVCWGGTTVLLMRTNFSIAIVCMTYDAEDNTTGTENETLHQMYKPSDPVSLYVPTLYKSSSEDVCPGDDKDEEEEVIRDKMFLYFLI